MRVSSQVRAWPARLPSCNSLVKSYPPTLTITCMSVTSHGRGHGPATPPHMSLAVVLLDDVWCCYRSQRHWFCETVPIQVREVRISTMVWHTARIALFPSLPTVRSHTPLTKLGRWEGLRTRLYCSSLAWPDPTRKEGLAGRVWPRETNTAVPVMCFNS